MLDTRVSAVYSLGSPKISMLLFGAAEAALGRLFHSNEGTERAVCDGV